MIEDVAKQKLEIQRLLKANSIEISIKNYICALAFHTYAVTEKWNKEKKQFDISFNDPDHVKVSKLDLILYQLFYSDYALKLEDKYRLEIHLLKGIQKNVEAELIAEIDKIKG